MRPTADAIHIISVIGPGSQSALEVEGGSVTRAAERLGLKRQSLASLLKVRHKKLSGKRTSPVPRRKSIIKDPSKK